MAYVQEPTTPGKVPDRLAQRMTALNKAHEIKSYRARMKRDLKAGRISIREVLLDPSESMENMRLCELMLSLPLYGQKRIDYVLRRCNISHAKTVGSLTMRQRLELVSILMG